MPAGRHGCVCLLVLAALAGCAARPALRADRAYEVSAAWVGGRAAVAWYGGHLAHEALFLGWFDARGRAVGPTLQLTDASLHAFEPSLQQLESDALVAWYEQADVAGTPRRQIAWLARFDSNGRAVWRRQLSAEEARGRIPVIRVAGSVIHAAWLEQRGGSSPVLRVARLDAAGNWLEFPRDVATAGLETWNLNAAVDLQGRFHVVFDSEAGSRAKELQWVIMGAESPAHHVPPTDDGFASVFPDIAVQGLRYALSWVDSSDGNDEIHLRCGDLGADGTPVQDLRTQEALTRRVTDSPGQSLGAYVAWYGNDIELAWLETTGKRSGLWRQRFDRHCRARSAAVRVRSWGEAGIPSLASSPSGLVLAWNAMRGPTSIVQLQVWSARTVNPSAAAR
jgi:hypothetical protein